MSGGVVRVPSSLSTLIEGIWTRVIQVTQKHTSRVRPLGIRKPSVSPYLDLHQTPISVPVTNVLSVYLLYNSPLDLELCESFSEASPQVFGWWTFYPDNKRVNFIEKKSRTDSPLKPVKHRTLKN